MALKTLRRPLLLLVLAGTLAAPFVSGVAAAPASSPAPVPALVSSPARAQAQPQGQNEIRGIPPAPSRWVTDEAGLLSPQTVRALDARLEGYERQTGHQLLVWIGTSLGQNQVLEDWAVRTFEAWQVGRKGLDDGLVLFIFARDRRVRIEVGYGLEDKVPDIYAFRTIDGILAPGFRAGRPDEAVEAAVTALIGYISGGEGPAEEGRPAPASRRIGSTARSIFTGIIVVIVIIIFITNPSLAFWLLLNILGGGRGGRGGGGWGGGGGGFGGGGGRSGGGGASGGW